MKKSEKLRVITMSSGHSYAGLESQFKKATYPGYMFGVIEFTPGLDSVIASRYMDLGQYEIDWMSKNQKILLTIPHISEDRFMDELPKVKKVKFKLDFSLPKPKKSKMKKSGKSTSGPVPSSIKKQYHN